MTQVEFRPSVPREIIGSPEKKTAVTQAVTIRTNDSPDLLRRALSAVTEGRDRSRTKSRIVIGVLDNTEDPVIKARNKKVVSESGADIRYLSTQETEHGTPLRRTLEKALERAAEQDIDQSEVLHAYHYLLTEQPELRSLLFLDNLKVGKGGNATSNVATLLGAYMLGATGTSQENGVITHYDHDVIPGKTLLLHDSVPDFELFDPYAQREEAFKNPDRMISTGKYTGTAGDPFGTAEVALRVTKGILDDIHEDADPSRESEYSLYDASTDSFRSLTVQEAYDNLPDIVHSFLVRAPNTGFLTADGPELTAFNSANIKFDGGNYTARSELARTVPVPPTGIQEFGVLGPLKALYAEVDPYDLIHVETPTMHMRAELPAELDVHAGGLLNGTYGRIIRHQILVECALDRDPSLKREIIRAFGGTPVTSEVHDEMPRLNTDANTQKKKRIEHMRQTRDQIKVIADGLAGTDPVKQSLMELIDEFNDGTLDTIVQTLAPSSQKDADVQVMIQAIRKNYLPAIRLWPLLFDAAYEVGLEDAA